MKAVAPAKRLGSANNSNLSGIIIQLKDMKVTTKKDKGEEKIGKLLKKVSG